jgi:hypothetical protein
MPSKPPLHVNRKPRFSDLPLRQDVHLFNPSAVVSQEPDEISSYIQPTINSKQTLDITEQVEMIATRKRMTLLYQILVQWRQIARQSKFGGSELTYSQLSASYRPKDYQVKQEVQPPAFQRTDYATDLRSSDSSDSMREARRRFKELQAKKSITIQDSSESELSSDL